MVMCTLVPDRMERRSRSYAAAPEMDFLVDRDTAPLPDPLGWESTLIRLAGNARKGATQARIEIEGTRTAASGP